MSLRPAKAAWPILTINTSNNAVSRKEVPLGGPSASKNFQGVHFPQNPRKIGSGIGISSLNKSVNNFSTVHVIFTQISSISAAWQNKFRNLNEIPKHSFYGFTFFFEKKTPRMGISSQNTLLINFLPVQPIFTCSTPVD
jgi:hypothetical protein